MTSSEKPRVTGKEGSGWPFPHVRRVGDIVYAGLQVFSAADGQAQGREIETQTHGVFRALETRLQEAGAGMADLTKLHTYYQYTGEGKAVTRYWERMTAARLEHLADPGPAATALRVQGMAPGASAIGVDGIADLSAGKIRIMPRHAWDWSIPTPFSQGWLAGNKVYVGGQISADRQGHSIAPGQVVEQTSNTLEYIRHVLLDAKAGWEHVVSIKVAHKWTDDRQASEQLARQILLEVENVFPGDKPALTTLGVDLLYEGLVLEIDVMAVTGPDPRSGLPSTAQRHAPVWPAACEHWHELSRRFPPGWEAGGQVYLGAHCAPALATLDAQFQETLARIAATLQAAGSKPGDLVKVNVFYRSETDGSEAQEEVARMTAILGRFLEQGRTVVSMVRTAGFLLRGQRVQVDGLAVLGQP